MVEMLHSAPPEIQIEEEPPQNPNPAPQKFDWEGLAKSIIMKHPREIKSLVKDLDPDTREMVFQMVEAKYPGYSGIAKMVIGSGNGEHSRDIQEEIDNGYPLDDEKPQEDPEPDMDVDILNEAADYAGSLYMNGYNWTQISDMLYRKYDIDWHPIRVQSVVLKRLAWKSRTQEKDVPKKEEAPKPQVIPKEPHRGLIRKALHYLW